MSKKGVRISRLNPLAEPLGIADQRPVVHGGDTYRSNAREVSSISAVLADGVSTPATHPDFVARVVYLSFTWTGGASAATIILPDLADVPPASAYTVFGIAPITTGSNGLRVSGPVGGTPTTLLTFADGAQRSVQATFVTNAAHDSWLYVADLEGQAGVPLQSSDWLSVTDYGAVGDGVTDDTAAIAAAILAFELDATKTVLYWPSGTYFLDTLTADAQTTNAAWRYLHLGLNDLTGRNITWIGEENVTVLSNAQSPLNGHMFMVHPSFNSFDVRNITFEKVAAMQKGFAGVEPNHCTTFAVLPQSVQQVERISFTNCISRNNHSFFAIHSANGNLTRGKLRKLQVHDCYFENRYGSNVDVGKDALGGGQTIRASHWCHSFEMTETHGVGAMSPLDEAGLSPGGVMIDALFFGGAENILVHGCFLENYAVEWMFAEATGPSSGFVETSFTMPAPDGIETRDVVMRDDELSDYTALIGQRISLYKVESVAGETGNASEFEITAWDAGTRTLTIVNPVDRIGFGQATEGATIGALRRLFEYEYETGSFVFSDTVMERTDMVGERNEGGIPSTRGQGIACPSAITISNCTTRNMMVGVEIYANVHLPNKNRTRGTLITGHKHYGRDTEADGPDVEVPVGIRSEAPDVHIVDAQIVMATAIRCNGIGLRLAAEGSRVVRPNIWTKDQAWGVNTDALRRSVGVSMTDGITDIIITDPKISGFNRGIGGISVSGLVNYEVRGRFSGSGNEKDMDLLNLGFAYANVPHAGHAYSGDGTAAVPVEGAGTERAVLKILAQGAPSNSYVDDDDLIVPVEVNANYLIEGHVILRGDATNGWQILMDVPSGSAIDGSYSVFEDDGTPVTGVQNSRYAASVIVFRDTFIAVRDSVFHFTGYLNIGATAGDVKITFRKRFDNTGGDTFTRIGSWMKLHRQPDPFV